MKQSSDQASAVAPTSDGQSVAQAAQHPGSGQQMTPDELRKLAPGVWDSNIPRPWIESAMLAAADAWEKQVREAVIEANKCLELCEDYKRAMIADRKRLEAAEKAIYDGRLYPRHFEAWADQIEIDQGYSGSEVSCLLRRLAALAGKP